MSELKEAVREHWEKETCGTRYSERSDRRAFFDELSEARYRLEPYIPSFARFENGAGLEILEIGIGAGADFANWVRHAKHATGVDLTARAVELTGERLDLEGVDPSRYTLREADAENLPFADASFDLVYSWGVLHHTPETPRAFTEVFRVLRPGGQLRAMIYHVPSWTGFLLRAQHGWLRGRLGMTQKEALFHHLESPGTKAYTLSEARAMLAKIGYTDVRLSTNFGPGDLLNLKLSDKYRGGIYRLIALLYPRWLVRLLGPRFGLNLMIEAVKPS